MESVPRPRSSLDLPSLDSTSAPYNQVDLRPSDASRSVHWHSLRDAILFTLVVAVPSVPIWYVGSWSECIIQHRSPNSGLWQLEARS